MALENGREYSHERKIQRFGNSAKDLYGRFPNQDPDNDRNLKNQVNYLINELKGSYNGVLRLAKEQDNVSDSTFVWLHKYEVPADRARGGNNHTKRTGHAHDVLKTYTDYLKNSPEANTLSVLDDKRLLETPNPMSEVAAENNEVSELPIPGSGFNEESSAVIKTEDINKDNVKYSKLQETLGLKFTPTAGKNTAEISQNEDETFDILNPLANAETIYSSMDDFAANNLKGKERAWYEMYGNLSKDELEAKFNEEGIKGIDTSVFGRAAGIEISDKDRRLMETEGWSGFITKYLKDRRYADKLGKTGSYTDGWFISALADILNGRKPTDFTWYTRTYANTPSWREDNKRKAVQELDEYVKKYLSDPTQPLLSSSIYYHTDKETRGKLFSLFKKGGNLNLNEKYDDIEAWEEAHLGKARIAQITKDRFNASARDARAAKLKELEENYTDEAKTKYLERFIETNVDLEKGETWKDENGNITNFEPINKITSELHNIWSTSDSKKMKIMVGGKEVEVDRKSKELSKPLDNLIRKVLNLSSNGILLDTQIQAGFDEINRIMREGTREEKLKISKELVHANVINEMEKGVKEIEQQSETDTLDFMNNLLKNNMDTAEGEEYLKTRLGISDEYVWERLKKNYQDGKLNDKSIEILKNTKLYQEAKEAVDNYHAGNIAEVKALKEVIIPKDAITGKALEDLQKLASIPILSTDTNQFSLLKEMGKDLTSADIPSMQLDQLALQKNQEEALREILRVMSINSYYSKIIAETNYDLLNVDLLNLGKDQPTQIISQDSDNKTASITQST